MKLLCFRFGSHFFPKASEDRHHGYDATQERFCHVKVHVFLDCSEKNPHIVFGLLKVSQRIYLEYLNIFGNLTLQPNIQLIFSVAYHFWCDITENLLIKASSLMHTLPL